MKRPKKRNLQEIVLVARSKFAGVELAYSSALSKAVSSSLGLDEKSVLCSVELDEEAPVYGLNSDSTAVLLKYNSRILIPGGEDRSKVNEIVKKSIEDFFKSVEVEFKKFDVSDNLVKLTFLHSSIELPPVVVAESTEEAPAVEETPGEAPVEEEPKTEPELEEKKPEEPKVE